MTKKDMRIKEVGATINLGNYSSLHITLGEESEFAGLDLGRAQKYLKRIAKASGGTLNLPDAEPKKKAKKKTPPDTPTGEKLYSFKTDVPIYYNHATHTYTDEKGVIYDSVTQVLSTFYPFNANGVIKQEYMDFAASFGNLIHTTIQNSVLGLIPKKELVGDIARKALEAMGDYDEAFSERAIALPKQEIAGRFDIVTRKDDTYTLWDVKTNSELFAKVDCTLPKKLKEYFSEFWATDTTFGEHCLQLNLYAYIIEQTTDITIDSLKIIYVPDSFSEIVDVPKVDITPFLQAYGETR